MVDSPSVTLLAGTTLVLVVLQNEDVLFCSVSYRETDGKGNFKNHLFLHFSCSVFFILSSSGSVRDVKIR